MCIIVTLRSESEASSSYRRTSSGQDSYASTAGSYLLHALDEFRNAGSADALYRELPHWYKTDSLLTPIERDADARQRRLRHLRATTLFAALSAEGYANEFLASRLSGRELEAADRLPTLDKFVLGPKLAGLRPSISYDCEPGQSLRSLFKARNALVHPPTRRGAFPDLFEAEDNRPYEPLATSRWMIQVAHAQVLLYPLRGDQSLVYPAKRIWEQRAVLEDHAKAIGAGIMDIPKMGAEPIRDLMAQMIDRAGREKRRERESAPPHD